MSYRILARKAVVQGMLKESENRRTVSLGKTQPDCKP
jgi:hypothetical protein